MSKAIRVLIYIFFLFLIVTTFACVPSKKNTYYEKKKKNSTQVNSSQLGRNRYYFSSGYQKKLNKTFKKNRLK